MDDSDSVKSFLVPKLPSSYPFPKGFYTIYRNLFTRLALEEAQHSGDEVNHWPSFGDPTWPWIAANKDDDRAARHFYNAWLSFVTEKDFSWMDIHNPNEAPDRRVKRWIQHSSEVPTHC
jgi:DnaJ homolog subfamily A member 5